jgi:hypothetical protein
MTIAKFSSAAGTFGRHCRALAAIGALAGLSACASAADPGAMTVAAQTAERPFPQALQHAMCIRSVTGGEATNPLWVSKVDDNGFRSALSGSLDASGLAAPESGCTYHIDANLLGLSQPTLGLDLTVTSHVNYKVYDPSGQPLLLATVDAPYTAKFSDAFVAAERLKHPNEGAIRTSIEQFLDKLRDSTPK